MAVKQIAKLQNKKFLPKIFLRSNFFNDHISIAPDKAAYCVFTQFRERENAIKLISVRTKTQ